MIHYYGSAGTLAETAGFAGRGPKGHAGRSPHSSERRLGHSKNENGPTGANTQRSCGTSEASQGNNIPDKAPLCPRRNRVLRRRTLSVPTGPGESRHCRRQCYAAKEKEAA